MNTRKNRRRDHGIDAAHLADATDVSATQEPDSKTHDALAQSGPDIKTIQLCRQVAEAVASALACARSPLLRDLLVADVQPVRGASVLRVLVEPGGDAHEDSYVDETRIEETLRRASGYIRSEVARAINRKRVPTLQFAVLPPAPGDWEEDGDDW